MMGEWNEEAIDTIIETLEPEKVEQESPTFRPTPEPLQLWGYYREGGGCCLYKMLKHLDLFRFREGWIYLGSMCGLEGWIYLGSMYWGRIFLTSTGRIFL